MLGKLITILLVILAGACVGMLLSLRGTNCGGNSAALCACRQFVTLCWITINERRERGEDRPFTLGALRDRWGESELRPVTRVPMMGGDLLVLDPAIEVAPGTKTMLVVCPEAYGNIPEPSPWNFFRRNMAHAAGYSDGTCGLITPAEFSALERERFIKAEEWLR